MRKAAVFIFVALAAPAQTVDPQAIFDKVRLNVAATVEHAPRYTCTETVERYWYANRRPIRPGCDTDRPPEITDRNLVRSDRLRLDVAVGSGQEIFSWHGQKSFQTEEIDDLVTAGPISSGTYFAFLSGIFLEGKAKVDFRGFRDESGKESAVFGFSVPNDVSKFEIRIDSGKEVTGYHGELIADVATGELQKIEIETDNMPEAARVCRFVLNAHYAATVLNGVEFQLPKNVEMDILDINHEHTKSVTQYADCHRFLGESVLRFDSDPGVAATKHPTLARTLPIGLKVQIRIASKVDPETAWAGDPINGELAADLLDDRGTVLVPKGAPVQGRLLRLETWRRGSRFYTVALQFNELQFAGQDYALKLRSTPEPVPVDQTKGSIRRRIRLENPAISDDPAGRRFRLSDKQVKLKGVITYWLTI